MIKVSIIVPVYNGSKYVERCIKSIVYSKDKYNVEIIAIDDKSKDNSLEVLNKLSNKYKDIKLITNTKNIGVAKTRNKGIEISRGDYLIFLDQDDFLDDNFIADYVGYIEEGVYDAVFGGYRRILNGKNIRNQYPKQSQYGMLLITAPWAKIFNRNFIIKNNIRFFENNIGEDLIPILKIIKNSNNIKVVNDISYNWSYNEKSVSNTKQKNIDNNNLTSLISLLNEINKIKLPVRLRKYFILRTANFYLYNASRTGCKNLSISVDKTYQWLESKNILNLNLVTHPPRNELLRVKLLNILLYILYRLKLLNIFINLLNH